MTLSLDHSLLHLTTTLTVLLQTLLSLLPSLTRPRPHTPSHSHSHSQAIKDALHVLPFAALRLPHGSTCAVCLADLRPDDAVRVLGNCRHVFHKGCLDRWVDHDDNGTCPLCRKPLLADSRDVPDPPPQPSWVVDRLLYIFGDDL